MKQFLPIFLFCLMGCASTYHREGFFGDGYSEIITNRDTYSITYKGNEYTSAETALRFALLRAAELTMTNGYTIEAIAKLNSSINSRSLPRVRFIRKSPNVHKVMSICEKQNLLCDHQIYAFKAVLQLPPFIKNKF